MLKVCCACLDSRYCSIHSIFKVGMIYLYPHCHNITNAHIKLHHAGPPPPTVCSNLFERK